jgi:hypothetical protein
MTTTIIDWHNFIENETFDCYDWQTGFRSTYDHTKFNDGPLQPLMDPWCGIKVSSKAIQVYGITITALAVEAGIGDTLEGAAVQALPALEVDRAREGVGGDGNSS